MLVLDMRAQVLGHIRHYYNICFTVEQGANISGLISSVHRFQIGERSFRLDCHCCNSVPPPSRIIRRYHYNIIMIVITIHWRRVCQPGSNNSRNTIFFKWINLNGISQKIKNIKLTKTHQQNIRTYTPPVTTAGPRRKRCLNALVKSYIIVFYLRIKQ